VSYLLLQESNKQSNANFRVKDCFRVNWSQWKRHL